MKLYQGTQHKDLVIKGDKNFGIVPPIKIWEGKKLVHLIEKFSLID